MCNTPLLIRNKNLGSSAHRFQDTESEYVYVPCGHCAACEHLKQMYLIQRLQIESLTHYVFFFTLTYNRQSLPIYDDGYGFKKSYARVEDIQNMFHYIRNNKCIDRPFKYFVVSERGHEKHRPHWHGLLLVSKLPSDSPYEFMNLEYKYYQLFFQSWSHNVGTRKNPRYVQNFDYVESADGRKTFDFHFVRNIKGDTQDVSFYVTKYVIKSDEYEDKLKDWLYFNKPDTYKDIWKVIKSRRLMSKGFGLPSTDIQSKQLDKFIALSDEFPSFFDFESGKQYPLAPYLRKRYVNAQNGMKFYRMEDSLSQNSLVRPTELLDKSQTDSAIVRHSITKKRIKKHEQM